MTQSILPRENVGVFNSSMITYIAALLPFVVVFVCYLTAVYNGHVPGWLPMISDCGVYRPERFIFTIGLVISSCFLFLNAVLFYFFLNSYTLNGRRSVDRLATLLVFISSLGLCVLATANDTEDPVVHDVSAFVFFGFYLVFMIITTLRLYIDSNCRRHISSYSIFFKVVIIIFATIDICVCGILIIFFKNGTVQIWIALTEWIGVFHIAAFTLTFMFEFKHAEYFGAFLLQASPCTRKCATKV